MKRLLAASVAVFFIAAGTAEAAPRHNHKAHHRHFVPDANGNVVGHKPSGCPSAWCGCWLMQHLGLSERRLWRAIEWARAFPRTTPHVGAVAVWPHHVGIITGGEPGNWQILSGNDGHRVRERVRSTRGVVAFVEPHKSYASAQ